MAPATKKKVVIGSLAVVICAGLMFVRTKYDSLILQHQIVTAVSHNSTEPVKHIAYIKTHKTGSSTVASILIDYAMENNLTLALPAKQKGNKLGWPEMFEPSYVGSTTADILCYHSRYSQKMVEFMPSDTVYITSLRDPVSQLKSAFTYFDAPRCMEIDYETFLRAVDKEPFFALNRCALFFNWWLRNGQLYDLGVETIGLTDAVVQSTLNHLDKRLDLVIILEFLDESLILVRDRLRWTTDDVVYFKQNFQINKGVSKVVLENMTESEEQYLANKWNWADKKIYDHFVDKHKKIIAQKPEYYAAEVKKLQKRINLWMTRCVSRIIPGNLQKNAYLIPFNGDITGSYLLTEKGKVIDKCARLVMPELAKTRLINMGKHLNSPTLLEGESVVAKYNKTWNYISYE